MILHSHTNSRKKLPDSQTSGSFSYITYDLHNSDMNEGNIMTEYEEKFSAKGNPIHKVVARR